MNITTPVAPPTGGRIAASTAGSATVLTPVPGGPPALTAGRGGSSMCHLRTILNKDVAQTTDASYVTSDLSAMAPPGATEAVFEATVFSAAKDSTLAVRAVGVAGPSPASGGGISGDGSVTLVAQVANTVNCREITVRLGPDRKFQYKRTAFGETYFGLTLKKWVGGRGLTLGGVQVIVAGDANKYNAWPNGWTAPSTGSRLLAFISWDGVTPNDHVTGGAVWLIRNEGAAAMLFTGSTAGGSPLNEAWPYHNPSNPSQLIILANRLVAGAYYVTSANDGVTWSAPAALPAFTNGAPGGHQIPFNFILSRDGTKIYGTFYDAALGSTVWLGESTNGVNFAFRSFITTSATFAGNETTIGYLPDGRLVAVIRNATQTAGCGTCYSDDDGLTWSSRVVQTSAVHGERPVIPLGTNVFGILSRYVPLSGFNGICTVLFNRNGTEIHQTAPFYIGGAGEIAYPTVLAEPDGVTYAYFYSDCAKADGLGRADLVKAALEIHP